MSISINTRRSKRRLANDSEYGSFYATNSSSRFVIASNIPKRKVKMKTLIQKTRYFRSTGSNLVIGLIFALTLSVLSISPALADRDHDGGGHWGGHHGWHGGYGHGYGGGRGGYGYGYGGYQPGYPQPYGYVQPSYIPPPVYYPPQQSPGITLFFPLYPRW